MTESTDRTLGRLEGSVDELKRDVVRLLQALEEHQADFKSYRKVIYDRLEQYDKRVTKLEIEQSVKKATANSNSRLVKLGVIILMAIEGQRQMGNPLVNAIKGIFSK